MAYLNIKQAMREIAPGIVRSRQNLALGAALSHFNRIKKELVEGFDNHEVTKEIKAAENSGDPQSSPNSSGLLDGKGNLFTFLGFTLGRKPTEEVRKILEEINLNRRPNAAQIVDDGIIFSFSIVGEDVEDRILANSKLEWENNSWVEGIERGVSGFSNYIYWKRFSQDISRSTGGIQVQNQLRAASMKTTDYLLKRLEKFRRDL